MSTTVQVKNSTKHIQLICVTGLFAAMIYVLTAWLHIPTGAGYTHAGDGLIYLAASMLPTPYAMAAGAIGAGLADGLSGFVVWLWNYRYKGDNCPLLFKKDREKNPAREIFSALSLHLLYAWYATVFMREVPWQAVFQRAQ